MGDAGWGMGVARTHPHPPSPIPLRPYRYLALFPEPVMLSVVALVAVASFQTPAPIRGFPRSLVADEVRREQTARLVPHPDTLRAQLRALSAEPHEAGTERSRRVAEQILARFRAFGLDARIEQFDALMPRPVARTLELVAPERYTAQLQEPRCRRTPPRRRRPRSSPPSTPTRRTAT